MCSREELRDCSDGLLKESRTLGDWDPFIDKSDAH